jgi:hypothetical protein
LAVSLVTTCVDPFSITVKMPERVRLKREKGYTWFPRFQSMVNWTKRPLLLWGLLVKQHIVVRECEVEQTAYLMVVGE